jgi:hypothetical protein
MNNKQKMILNLVISQLDDATAVIKGSIVKSIMDNADKLDEEQFFTHIKELTSNPFKTIEANASEVSKEYEEFTNSPEMQELKNEMRELLNDDPDKFLEKLEEMRDGEIGVLEELVGLRDDEDDDEDIKLQ